MTSNMPFRWPEEAVETLKAEWAAGKSASQIAEMIGHGVSRSAVIGKVFRLKLKRMTDGTQTSSIASRAQKAKASRSGKGQPKANAIIHNRIARREQPSFDTAPLPEEGMGNDVTHLIGIMDLKANSCRYIHGDPLHQHGYCGKEALPKSSWCEEHHHVVFGGRS